MYFSDSVNQISLFFINCISQPRRGFKWVEVERGSVRAFPPPQSPHHPPTCGRSQTLMMPWALTRIIFLPSIEMAPPRMSESAMISRARSLCDCMSASSTVPSFDSASRSLPIIYVFTSISIYLYNIVYTYIYRYIISVYLDIDVCTYFLIYIYM